MGGNSPNGSQQNCKEVRVRRVGGRSPDRAEFDDLAVEEPLEIRVGYQRDGRAGHARQAGRDEGERADPLTVPLRGWIFAPAGTQACSDPAFSTQRPAFHGSED